jgi:hypothetical protein
VLPGLPSNEKNSSNHHNSYNKGPNFAFFNFTESPSNSLPTIKFPKNHITSSYYSNMPKIAKAKIGPLRTLGVTCPSLIKVCIIGLHSLPRIYTWKHFVGIGHPIGVVQLSCEGAPFCNKNLNP